MKIKKCLGREKLFLIISLRRMPGLSNEYLKFGTWCKQLVAAGVVSSWTLHRVHSFSHLSVPASEIARVLEDLSPLSLSAPSSVLPPLRFPTAM